MKIQFCNERFDPRFKDDVVAEFDVAEEPTDEQCKAIEDEIFEVMDNWYEESDNDFREFDYWGVCYAAVKKHLKIIENQVVKTFYL